jgi:RHS repeat-associated protein
MATVVRHVQRSSLPPVLTISSPMDGAILSSDSVLVSGRIASTSTVTLTINGTAKSVNTDGTFSHKMPIIEGQNHFALIATDALGQRDSSQVSVVRDTRLPLVNIISPAWTPYTTDSTIVIMGSVVDSSGLTLSVNGVYQQLDGIGSFQTPMSLAPGVNTFTIQATDLAGNSTTVIRTIERVQKVIDPATVAPLIDRTVTTTVASATEFLYIGTDPIQKNVAPGTINALRVTALRGRVLDQLGNPLSGVTIRVSLHPELGFTLSRDDGMYDLVVNGGSSTTLDYTRSGFLPAQRTLDARWQTYGSVDDVVLLAADTIVHHIDFVAPEGVQGKPVTDEVGTRRPTVFFEQGTQASLVFQTLRYRTIPGCSGVPANVLSLPTDSLVPINGITVRVQEYSVGADGEKALPAPLPSTVAYSFAFELQADEVISRGATSAQLSQPATLLLENVMNFPEGMSVPLGYYDRTKAGWLPCDNGQVIRVLGSDTGYANIDFNGDGFAEHPDSLLIRGISYAEQQYLATVYGASQSLLRVEFTKLGTYAIGYGFVLPAGAKAPSNPLPDRYPKVDRDNIVAGSVIGVQSQMLGESVPIVNTNMSLHYRSDRVEGRREAYTLDIPLTGSPAPDSVLRVEIEVEVAGQVTKQTYTPQANLKFQFEWDGKDVYGRKLQGQQNVLTTISYYYQTRYAIPADWSKSFSTPTGQVMIRYIPARKEMAKTQIWEGKIGAFDILSLGIGGWSLSQHHGYDVLGRILYTGDGQVRSARVMDNVITTIAGISTAGQNQICHPQYATPQPALQIPMGVVGNVRFRADGSLWLSEANKLRKLDTTGIISTIAGLRGNCGSPYPDTTEGIMANCATFGAFDMIEGPDKSIYIAHGAKEHIWRITPDGELKHFAGVFYNTGSNGYLCYADGDGGPALKAHLGRLSEMAFGKDGSLYFADMFNHRIRKISPDGIITTVAGASKNYMDYGYSGDGGPAIKAKMYEIRGFAMGPDGSLFISDYRNHRIRKVTPDGIIATIAGTGVQGSTGDGGRAIYARVAYPYSMTVGNDGTLYFCETGGKVRAISTDGYIKTIVGSGSTQWLNNGPATAAQVGPQDAEFGADRNLYVSDWPFILSPARVTRVGPPLPGMQLSEILVASEDGSEQYVFTLSGRHLRTLDALTGVTKYTFNYDTQNRLVSIVDIDSLVTTIERDTSGKATAIISPYGVRTQLALDANGYLLHATNPANESRQFTYTDKGLMTSMTDARGSTYTYTYDSLGYLTKDMDPIGGFTAISRAYDSTGYTVTATTAMGKVTKYRVDQLRDGSKQFTTTDPNGLKTTTSDGTNGTATSTAPNGMQIPIEQKPDPRFGMQSPLINLTTRSPGGVQANLNQYRKITQMSGTSVTAFADSVMVGGKNHRVSYDGIQKVVTRTSPEGRRTFSYFDSKGKTVKDSVPGITAVTYKYDAKGRKIETKQGARITRFEYDDFGNLQRFIDTYGRTASYNHDAADRLVRKVAPDSTEISFAYDSNGNTVSITPPGRPPHIFDYSLIDLETLYTPPFAGDSARSTASLYNRDREIVKIARSDSLNIEYVYGGNASLIGYPKKILYDRGQLTVLYDTIRATITGLVTQNGDSITYQYDGDLLKKISWSGAVRGNLAYTYSNDRLVITEKANVSDSVNFKYDRDGLLAAAGALKLVYSPLNNLLLSDTLAGLITEYSYDSMGDLSGKRVKYAGDYLAQTEYVRDSLGYIIEERSIFEGIQTKHSYSYDGARRLWRAWKNDTLVSTYGYDQGGNRLSLTTPSNVVTGSYDDQDKLLTYGNVSFVYSESGDLRKRIEGADSTWYDYDALGNLLRVLLPTGDNIEYVIDGGGRRVARKVNGIVTNRWIYRDGLRIVAELDSSSQIIARYVYAGKVNVPEYVLKNGVMYRVVTDHLGSVNLVINTNTGQVVQKIEYDEYGKVLFDSNPGFVPFGFAGGLYDPQTRLVRFGARDYDASVGRWTVKDPARFEGKDVNFYGYVGQNPINETDPQGFWWEPEHRKLTSDAMVANGFKAGSDEIRMAQEANIWVDRPSNQLNNPEHGMPECSLSAITAVQNAYLANAIISSMLADITGDNSLAMSFLGAGLHVVQDQYAHYEQGFHGSWVGHGLGAVGSVIGLWSSPDDPNANKEYLDKAAAASDNYVKRFLQRKF